MSSIFKIDCTSYKLNGANKTLGSDKKVETIDNKEIHATFYIKCDNQDDNDSFNLDYYGMDEMVVEKDRCEVNVYIKENKTPYDNSFTIICSHANDSAVSIEIEIIQKADTYKLEITNGAQSTGNNTYTKQMESIVNNIFHGKEADMNYNYYEEYTFDINVLGGSKKYRIESIMRCHEDTEDGQINYLSFDNGFIYNKFDDKLVIISYGRPFTENDYYLVRLCHENYREISLELKLTYSQQRTLRSTSSITRRGRKKKVQYQKSDVYMPYELFIETKKSIDEANKGEYVICKIAFDVMVGKEFIVLGQKEDVILPFKVFENGNISNLMVMAHATGNWCTATTDETNRNLIIKINDVPICERKSLVKINVIDYPETSISFVLINRP